MRSLLIVSLALSLLCGCAVFKPAVQSGVPRPADTTAQKPPTGMKPYSQVITKEAKSDTGLFIVHRIKDKLYFEIPEKELKKEFLLVSNQAKIQAGLGYGGDAVNRQVVNWERVGDRILLRSVLYSSAAADSLPISYAVKKANLPPIIMGFEIQAVDKDSSSAVVDATDLFASDVPEMGMGKFTR
ncbi:MAG: DUF5117 domain-containing protein, partial [Bacteroidota bacterium]